MHHCNEQVKKLCKLGPCLKEQVEQEYVNLIEIDKLFLLSCREHLCGMLKKLATCQFLVQASLYEVTLFGNHLSADLPYTQYGPAVIELQKESLQRT